MTIEISLREMTIDDLEVVNLIRNDDRTRLFLRNTEKISLNQTVEWFKREKPRWFVILEKDTIVGYIRTSQDTKESICIGCDIDPKRRGLGIAKKAYENTIKSLYKEGYLLVWLEVFSNNIVAHSLYKKLGFREIGERRTGERTAIIMVHSTLENE